MDENGGYPCLGDGLRFCFLARVLALAALSFVGICACAGFALRAVFSALMAAKAINGHEFFCACYMP